MIENVVERVFQIFLRGLIGGQVHAVEQLFGQRGMMPGIGLHRHAPELRAVVIGARIQPVLFRHRKPAVAPAGEHVRETFDHAFVIGRNRQAIGVEHERSVGMQFVQPDGKQLQDFARVIFVGAASAGRVFLVIAQHVQIATHRRTERHIFEQLPEVAKRVLLQHVHISGDGVFVAFNAGIE